jgi:galactokinase
MDIASLKDKFRKMFGRAAAGVVAAPGRVNLIGEHTDYNNGFVLPIALKLRTLAAWAPRDDGRVGFASLQQPGKEVEVDLCSPIEPGQPRTGQLSTGQPKWANYPKGVAAGLLRRGEQLNGCNVLFSSDVPIGSGLSSSASLEVAAALALLAAAEKSMDGRELALLCQAAEHEFAGTPCGIMDQSISVMGRVGKALLLDCKDGGSRLVPFDDPNMVLLVCDTQVEHELNDGGYASRRAQCFSAAKKMHLPSLREATAEMVAAAATEGKLDDMELKRARHVVSEIARTLQAVKALEAGDLPAFGELMYASHESLRDDFEVSCPELDVIVSCAGRQGGVYGARMTGGGFGGCAIVLVAADRAEAIRNAIRADFQEKYGRACPVFATHAAAGAGTVE